MATVAEKIVELETERAVLVTAINEAVASGQSFSQGQSFSRTGVSYQSMLKRRDEIDVSIQRLQNGGRGITIDMSTPADPGNMRGQL